MVQIRNDKKGSPTKQGGVLLGRSRSVLICAGGCLATLFLLLPRLPLGENEILRKLEKNHGHATHPAVAELDAPSKIFVAKQAPLVLQNKTYEKPKQTYHPTKYSLTDYTVAGVNLGQYGFPKNDAYTVEVDPKAPPFELYNDFDIAKYVRGDETWRELLGIRRRLQRRSLSFYGDKVAQKRWMKAVGIPTPKSFVLKYKSELTESGEKDNEEDVISILIPKQTNYVAKPTHRSGSSGVWVVKYNQTSEKTVVGYGGDDIGDPYDKSKIVKRLVEDLHRTAAEGESWALRHAQPGFMLEERFTNTASLDKLEDDEKSATEFKAFIIWGKVWVVNWKRGVYRRGLVHRNGTMVDSPDKLRDALPDWVDWDRIINLAETLGAHKDLFRVDIFVGVPADSPAVRGGATQEEQVAAIQYAVSETAFHPTTKFKDDKMFDEAARLWMAGYKMGNWRAVPNTEIPEAYRARGMLSEEDAELLRLARTSSSSSVLVRASS